MVSVIVLDFCSPTKRGQQEKKTQHENYGGFCSRLRVTTVLGGSSQLGSEVNKHGDRKSPRPGVVGPCPNALLMAYEWG